MPVVTKQGSKVFLAFSMETRIQFGIACFEDVPIGFSGKLFHQLGFSRARRAVQQACKSGFMFSFAYYLHHLVESGRQEYAFNLLDVFKVVPIEIQRFFNDVALFDNLSLFCNVAI